MSFHYSYISTVYQKNNSYISTVRYIEMQENHMI